MPHHTANLTRTLHNPGDAPISEAVKTGHNLVEIAFQQYHENREDRYSVTQVHRFVAP